MVVGFVGILVAAGAERLQAQQTGEVAVASRSSSTAYRAVLDRYCVTCHNERLQTADLALDVVSLDAVSADAALWEKVVRKLRTRTMPPLLRPRPANSVYDEMVSWLEVELDTAASAAPHPGNAPVLHRLNRAEYANSVRDLLALDFDASTLLPPDDASYGFDNIGDVLRLSPTLLESYLDAARVVSAQAVGDPTAAVEQYIHRVPPDLTQDYHLDGLPFGTRGGIRLDRYFPVDGEYDVDVHLQRNFIGGRVMGLTEPHELEVSVDGTVVAQFTVGEQLSKDADSTENEAEQEEAARRRRFYDSQSEGVYRTRVPLQAGTRSIAVTFLERPASQVEATRLPYLRSFAILGEATKGLPHVDTVTITGPYQASVGDTPSRGRVFLCRPTAPVDEHACAMRILETLARRAYRRPVTEGDVETLLEFYESARQTGMSFDAGVQRALQRLLMSPDFLFRVERDPVDGSPGSNFTISDLDLASRLSFFLWSSLPDEELLSLAEQNQLQDPVVLEQQVRRMLSDERALALVKNFAGQWLYLRNVPHAAPDTRVFPDFDSNLRTAMRRETELLFETIIQDNRSVVELLNADYTFVNERLARHYGMPNVYGSHFRRVELDERSVRGGLLGQASIQMVTSYPNRTSPVLRGKWLLENILGMPPPDPPADVPALEETSEDGHARSMREAMVEHRANPVCASCHRVMDPLGFALENFDAVGSWRETEAANQKIDATGQLPSGLSFDGPQGLRDAVLRRPELFVGVVVERLLTYALGRGVEYSDYPTVRAIVRDAAQTNYRFSDLVASIAKSLPFQMRRIPS